MSASRLFVALELPPEVQKIPSQWPQEVPGLKWSKAANLHLTLRFIGSVGPEQKALIKDSLNHVHGQPFSLSLSTLGMFYKKTHALLWMGLEPNLALNNLKEAVDSALNKSIALPREPGRFKAHITLGRMKKPDKKVLQEFITRFSPGIQTTFKVVHFTLIHSKLRPEGPQYGVEARYFLHPEQQT